MEIACLLSLNQGPGLSLVTLRATRGVFLLQQPETLSFPPYNQRQNWEEMLVDQILIITVYYARIVIKLTGLRLRLTWKTKRIEDTLNIRQRVAGLPPFLIRRAVAGHSAFCTGIAVVTRKDLSAVSDYPPASKSPDLEAHLAHS